MTHNPSSGEKIQGDVFSGKGARLSSPLILLLAVATGMNVASIYYAQPLLEEIRTALGLSIAHAGLVVTATQLGYALGLLLLVPLGDLLERRKLSTLLTLGIGLSLYGIGRATNAPTLLAMSLTVGILSVVAQILVAFAADLAGESERGRVVGTVMSGLLLGILLARTAAGILAQLGGWRFVFHLAAGLMLVIAAMIFFGLPHRKPVLKTSYRALLRSIPTLLSEEPVLRLRTAYGTIAFAAFSALWTPLAFLLSQPPFNFTPGTIGLFGLAGVAGAGAASVAGHLADRGSGERTTAAAIVLLIISWIPLWLGRHSVIALIGGILLLDLGVQALHITNQSEIYRLRPEARSRLTSSYMSFFFAGGVFGSSLSSIAYSEAGWTGVCVLGSSLGLLALAVRSLARARNKGWVNDGIRA